MREVEHRPYDRVKRGLDIAVAVVALVLTLPIQVIVAGLVCLFLGRPVLFRQDRPGKDEQVFRLLKFRSMKHPTERLVTDEQRLTRFGKLLRASSLDELPSLINVLRGDMSLVGPRPLRTHYLPLYNSRQRLRHAVRPGITGLAQVRGRNLLSWEERFELDVQYVQQRSFKLDLRILFETVTVVLGRRGIAAEGSVTMTPFRGTPEGDR